MLDVCGVVCVCVCVYDCVLACIGMFFTMGYVCILVYIHLLFTNMVGLDTDW